VALDYLRFGRPELAAEHAERVFEIVPRDPWAWARVAEDFAVSGDRARAGDYLARARRLAQRHGIDGVNGRLAAVEKQIEQPRSAGAPEPQERPPGRSKTPERAAAPE
jgi:hypothetical protein